MSNCCCCRGIKMSLLGEYNHKNVFARILRNGADVVRVMEDQHVIGFMDAFPQSPGHVLVIPKALTPRNLLDISSEELGLLILAVQRLTRAVAKALKPGGISVLQFNGAAGGSDRVPPALPHHSSVATA